MHDSTSTVFPERTVVNSGFWRRFLAAFLDGGLLLVLIVILRLLTAESFLTPSLWNSLSELILSWLYYALQESGQQQATLGKKALNIKVTNLDGGRISFGQATGRHFGKWVSMIIIFIGYLMMLWDDQKQTLHDKMAGTLVIKTL